MSAEPAISASGEYLYQRVLPLFQEDEQFGWFGRHLCDGLMAMMQDVDQIVLDTATHPGWTTILDPTVCPEAWLPWCAQLYGVTLPPNATIAEQRIIIEELPAQKRSTRIALVAAAEVTLTGAKRVHVEERVDGDAYMISVTTVESETPNEAATRFALLTQVPGGIKMFYSAEPSGTPLWDEATKKWSEVGPALKWSTVVEGTV